MLRRASAALAAFALLGCAAPTPSPSPTGTVAGPTSTPAVTSPAPTSSATASGSSTAGPTASPTPPASPTAPPASAYEIVEHDVPRGSRPHDVAPNKAGTVWYTGQGNGTLGRLESASGEVTEIDLGPGSAPHGVIADTPDGSVWVTDSGRNELQRIDPATLEVVGRYPVPVPNVNLNTATIGANGVVWFTGQAGYYGRVDPVSGEVELFDAPRGAGPYGIDATPEGRQVWFVSLAGSYLAQIDLETGAATVHDPPTAGAGLRRVWSDSQGRLWVSEWNAGQLGMYDPATDAWREWPLPGPDPQPYSVFVDALDKVWLTDFGSNSIVRFDPLTETFDVFAIPTANAQVRQQLGFYEVWGAESANDKLIVVRLILP